MNRKQTQKEADTLSWALLLRPKSNNKSTTSTIALPHLQNMNKYKVSPDSIRQGGSASVVTPAPGKERTKSSKVKLPNDGPMIKAAKEGIAAFGAAFGVEYKEHLPNPKKMSDGRHLLSFCANSFCPLRNHDAVVVIWEKEEMYSFHLRAPALIPKHLRTQVALYLTRVNHGLRGKSCDQFALSSCACTHRLDLTAFF